MDQWYIARGKAKVGPYSCEHLRLLASNGDLGASDMLLQDGARKWITAGEIPWLFAGTNAEPIFASAAAAQPPLAMPARHEAPGPPVSRLAEPANPLVAGPVATRSPLFTSVRQPWVWFAGGAVGLCAIVIASILLLAWNLDRPKTDGKRIVVNDRAPGTNAEKEAPPADGPDGKNITSGNRIVANDESSDANTKKSAPAAMVPNGKTGVPGEQTPIQKPRSITSDDDELSSLLSLISLEYRLDEQEYPRNHDAEPYEPLLRSKNDNIRAVAKMSAEWEVAALRGANVNAAFGNSVMKLLGVDKDGRPNRDALEGYANGDTFTNSFLDILRTQNERYSTQFKLQTLQDELWDRAEALARDRAAKERFDPSVVDVRAVVEDRKGWVIVVRNKTKRDLRHLTLNAFVHKQPVEPENKLLNQLLGSGAAGVAGAKTPKEILDSGKIFRDSVLCYRAIQRHPDRLFAHISTLPAGKEWKVSLFGRFMSFEKRTSATFSLWSPEGTYEARPIVEFNNSLDGSALTNVEFSVEPALPKSDGPFFNGKDLTGWQGKPGYWKVEDGSIVGAPADGVRAHTFLCSEQAYADFELTFKVRRKNGIGNSGVQFRSRLEDRQRFTVVGPQIEIDSDNYQTPPGSLVGEKSPIPSIQAGRKAIAKVWKNADFNEMTIRCVGRHVKVTVNGVVAVDADVPSMPSQGIIAWQMHGGSRTTRSPEQVTFKDIQFTDLSRKSVQP